LFEIVLPMVTPALPHAILCFLYAWNDFFFALILTPPIADGSGRRGQLHELRRLEWGKIAAGGSLVMARFLIFSLAVRALSGERTDGWRR